MKLKYLLTSPYIQYIIQPYYDGISFNDTSHIFATASGNIDLIRFLDSIHANKNRVHKRYKRSNINDYPAPKRTKSMLYNIINNYNSNYLYSRLSFIAISNDDMNMIKYFCEHDKYKYDKKNICIIAANQGKLHIIKFLYDNYHNELFNNSNLFILIFNAGCRYGRLNIIKWVIHNGGKYQFDHSINLAISGGYYDVVKFILQNSNKFDNPLNNNYRLSAIRMGRNDIAKLIYDYNN